MSSPDQVLEHKPNHSPWNVIQTRRGWDEANTTKQYSKDKRRWSVCRTAGGNFFWTMCDTYGKLGEGRASRRQTRYARGYVG